MAQAKSSQREGAGIEVSSKPSMQRIAIAVGVALLFFGFIFVTGPAPLLLGGIAFFLIGFALIGGGFYLMNYNNLMLRLSRDGLYIKKFDTLFPWESIARALLVSHGERMSSKMERMIESAKAFSRSEEPILLMIQMTSAGRRKFKGELFCDYLLRRFMYETESVCLWLGPMDCSAKQHFKSYEELVAAINKGAKKYGQAEQTTIQPLDEPLGTSSKRAGKKGKTGGSSTRSNHGMTVMGTIGAVVMLIAITFVKLQARNNGGRNNANNIQNNQQLAQPVQPMPANATVNTPQFVVNNPAQQTPTPTAVEPGAAQGAPSGSGMASGAGQPPGIGQPGAGQMPGQPSGPGQAGPDQSGLGQVPNPMQPGTGQMAGNGGSGPQLNQSEQPGAPANGARQPSFPGPRGGRGRGPGPGPRFGPR